MDKFELERFRIRRAAILGVPPDDLDAVLLPPSGVAEAAHGTLFGRPVIEIEHHQTADTQDDIILGDWSQYLVVHGRHNLDE